MKDIQELKEKLQKIIESSKYTENSLRNRDNIYMQIRELLDRYDLEDLYITVETVQCMIDRFGNYSPMNYEELANQLYIGPIPTAPLKDKLAWICLTEK